MMNIRGLCLLLLLIPHSGYSQDRWNDPEKAELLRSESDRYSRLLITPRGDADDNIDVTYYKLDLNVTTSPDLLSGIVTGRATSLMNGLSSVKLNLDGTMHVDSVRMNSQRVNFTQSQTALIVTLDRVYVVGENLEVVVFYTGVPNSTGFGSFEFSSQNGFPWVWSLSEPLGARDWWPCKDTPIDKADSADIIVTCAAGLKVGSNGRLLSVTDNGNGTWTHHWAERYPISTYLISVALTNYAEYSNWYRYSPTDSMQILNYVLPGYLQTAQAATPATVEALRIFSCLFGQYPFINEKYGHSQFGRGGAMEHQTMTSTTTFAEYVLVHELGHQWFGDMITCATWSDIWLNEGFAQYSEALYAEQRYGVDSYREFMASQLDGAKSAVGSIHTDDTTNVSRMFNTARTYQKGAAALHMLRHVVGDSNFFHILRSYANDPRFKYKSATTEGFKDVAQTVSGMNLGYFFDEWIYGEGYPKYAVNWESRSANSGVTFTLQLEQADAAIQFFTMPVDIRMTAGNWDTTVVVFNDRNNQTFTFLLPHLPEDVKIDPDGWILHDIFNNSLPSTFSLGQNYPNPFNAGTTITFFLPPTGTHHTVTLKLFDPLGREVKTILTGAYLPGRYSVRLDGGDLASGVYFYRLQAGGSLITKKLLLLR
jgi:aminopeptidase N